MHEVKTDRTERKNNIWGIAWSFSSCQSDTSSRWTDFKGAMAKLGEKQQMLNNLQHDCVVVYFCLIFYIKIFGSLEILFDV